MEMPYVILGRDGMGELATEDDFDSYVSLVCRRIDDICEFVCDVDVAQPRDVNGNRIMAETDDQESAIKEALVTIWDEWCSGIADDVR